MVGPVSTLPGDQNHVSNEKKHLSCCVYTTQLYENYFEKPL